MANVLRIPAMFCAICASSRRAAATVPLSVSRREDVERLRALARERFVPVR